MIKTVNTYSVIAAFSSENTHIYRIPKYQREYTWGMKECDALFNDIVENDDGYFLGSFICVSSGALNNTVELIDGQQRFTTLSIFLLSLYEKLSAFKDEFDDDEMTEYNNLKNQIANKSSEKVNGKKVVRYSPKLILQSQNHNEDDYNSLFEEAGIPFQVQKASNRGNRRIYKAYKHFKVLIEKYIADVQKEDQTLTESEIIFAIPSCLEDERKRILDICSSAEVPIKVIPFISDLIFDDNNNKIIDQIRDIRVEDLLGREPIKFDNDEVRNFISGKVCMVTGGGGSIGSELVRQISKYAPKQVIIVDIYENNAYDIQQLIL